MESILAALNHALIETEAQLFRLSEQRSALRNQIAAMERSLAQTGTGVSDGAGESGNPQ